MELREVYLEKMTAQLAEWQSWSARHPAPQADASTSRPGDPQRAYERILDCQRIARARLDELRSTQDERWEFAKQAVERAMIDLKRAMDDYGAAQSGSVIPLNTSRAHVYAPFSNKKG